VRINLPKLADGIFNNQQGLDAAVEGSGGVARLRGDDDR
jgi:hypothetical protein